MRTKSYLCALAILLVALVCPWTAPSASFASNGTFSETVGGAANTWTNYTNAGGTQGPTIPAFATVEIACKLNGFRVADGNTWWYQIASSPWNYAFYVSADAFYNNGATSGSLAGTPYVDPAVPTCGTGAGTNETTGGAANTWTNYTNAGGTQGPTIPAFATVQIACKLNGFRVADGNTWWYQIASSPWNYAFYVSADAFYNNGATSGTLVGTPYVDTAVPDCATQAGPAVSLAQGPAAPAGYRYAVTVDHFPVYASVSVSCRDSVDPGGFYTFSLAVDGNGHGSTQAQCYSGDGPDHWVVVNGAYESNHVTWGLAPPPTTGDVYTFTNGGRGATAGAWAFGAHAQPVANCPEMALQAGLNPQSGTSSNYKGPLFVDGAPVPSCFMAARGDAGYANVGGAVNAGGGSTAHMWGEALVQNFAGGRWGPLIIMQACQAKAALSVGCTTPASPARAAYVVRSGIWATYRTNDGITRLGAPLGNEAASGDGGAFQLFSRGMIIWSPQHGGKVVTSRPVSDPAEMANYSCGQELGTRLGYAGRNCTYYVALRMEMDGHLNPVGGDAKQWPDKIPWAKDHLPRPGDIGVMTGGTFGHVVYVDAVRPDGTLNVEDYNRGNDCAYRGPTTDPRSTNVNPSTFQWFIHPPANAWP